MAAVAGRTHNDWPRASVIDPWDSDDEDDRALLAAIARLSVRDIDDIQLQRASIGGHLTADEQLALQLAREEAQAQALMALDQDVARNLLLEFDANDFANPWPQRTQTAPAGVRRPPPPRVQPQQAANVPATPARTTTTTSSTSSSKGWFSTLTSWIFGPTTTNTTSAIPDNNRLTGNNCVICQDPIRGHQVRAPCGHYYDKTCMLDLFEASTRDESLYPPRCCRRNIPLTSVSPLMTAAFLKLFNEKAREFGTLKRVYCANPTCSVFLCAQTEGGSWFLSNYVTCSASGCNTITCSSCRTKIEPGVVHTCKVDRKDQEVLMLGERSQWARCPGCEQLIELNTGCNHMTCRCKTEFCYVCRARWKSCHCPQWDERRLVAAAEARVDAQHGIPAAVRHVPPPVPVRRPQPPPLRPQPPAPRPTIAPGKLNDEPPPLEVDTELLRTLPRPPVQTTRPTTAYQFGSLGGEGSSSRHQSRTTSTIPHPTPNATASSSSHASRLPFASTSSAASSSSHQENHLEWRQSRIISWQTEINAFPSNTTGIRPKSAFFPEKSGKPHNNLTKPKRKAIPSAERAKLVAEAVEHLRHNHECNHEKTWLYRPGAGRCENCHHHLPIYLYRCTNCELLSCKRCRWNRL